MANWFTSDQHFGHKNILEYCDRPFSNLDEMREALIANHNSVVQDDDFVWHLGDFSLHPRYVEEVLPRLKGRNQLIAGNHDHVFHNFTTRTERYLKAGFESVGRFGLIHIEGRQILLSHLPYEPLAGDKDMDRRFLELRPNDSGMWLLHGHEHGTYKQRRKMIDVGVDNWDYFPVHEGLISYLIRCYEHSLQNLAGTPQVAS